MVIINYKFHYKERKRKSDGAVIYPDTSAVAAASVTGKKANQTGGGRGGWDYSFTAINSSHHLFLKTSNCLRERVSD